jgi:hypothetical protein
VRSRATARAARTARMRVVMGVTFPYEVGWRGTMQAPRERFPALRRYALCAPGVTYVNG